MIIFLFVIALYASMIIYEIGHFIGLKINKLNADKVVLGIGPKLGFVKGEKTEYVFKLIPFGSYTELKREEGEDNNASCYDELNCLKKIITISSGFIFSFVIMVLLNLLIGIISGQDIMNYGISYSFGFIKTIYRWIYEMSVVRSYNLVDFLSLIVSYGINTFGMSIGCFIYFFSCTLGIIVAINILPLPLYSGGQVVLEILKRVFKISISDRIVSTINIITFVLSIIFIIYIIV